MCFRRHRHCKPPEGGIFNFRKQLCFQGLAVGALLGNALNCRKTGDFSWVTHAFYRLAVSQPWRLISLTEQVQQVPCGGLTVQADRLLQCCFTETQPCGCPWLLNPTVVIAVQAPRALGWTFIYMGTGRGQRGQLYASWCKIASLEGVRKRNPVMGRLEAVGDSCTEAAACCHMGKCIPHAHRYIMVGSWACPQCVEWGGRGGDRALSSAPQRARIWREAWTGLYIQPTSCAVCCYYCRAFLSSKFTASHKTFASKWKWKG